MISFHLFVSHDGRSARVRGYHYKLKIKYDFRHIVKCQIFCISIFTRENLKAVGERVIHAIHKNTETLSLFILLSGSETGTGIRPYDEV